VYVTHDQEEAMTLGDRVVVMKEGLIQQCGRALDVYRHPENRFVAGFLGSPPMNFFGGKLVMEDGDLLFDEGTAKLPIPDWARDQLASRAGSDVVLGVRPEAMTDESTARFATSVRLPMTVTLVQPLGDKMDIHLRTERHPRSIAHVDAHAEMRVGETIPICIDMRRAHFFAPGEPGERIAKNHAADDLGR
jgi:multiple sugar transport system ATP-binding protein